jgi:hypothetical protein
MFALSHVLRRSVAHDGRPRKALLGCGVIAPVVWVALDVIGSLRYPGYSYVDQTISELSAQGAPTKNFMLAFSGTPFALLVVAFGAGVWRAAGGRTAGRATGALLIGEAFWGYVGGIAFPMARREVMAAGQDTLRNQMHAWYGIGMPVLLALAIGFGSNLLGRRFRSFSYATIVAMLVFGALMGLQASAMTANEPTPGMGIEERVTAYAPMLWMALLALGLLRAESAMAPRKPQQLFMRQHENAVH